MPALDQKQSFSPRRPNVRSAPIAVIHRDPIQRRMASDGLAVRKRVNWASATASLRLAPLHRARAALVALRQKLSEPELYLTPLIDVDPNAVEWAAETKAPSEARN